MPCSCKNGIGNTICVLKHVWFHISATSQDVLNQCASLHPDDKPLASVWDFHWSGLLVELLLCSSQAILDLNSSQLNVEWTELRPNRAGQANPRQGRKSSWNKLIELNWTEALGPRASNWTERSFRTNCWLGNWTVLNWRQTILNFERADLVSSWTLTALLHIVIMSER